MENSLMSRSLFFTYANSTWNFDEQQLFENWMEVFDSNVVS